jgi:hypothetical protein
VLKLLEEGPSDPDSTLLRIDNVTVGYGQDAATFESWRTDVEWWTTVPPQEECTRFRIFYPTRYEAVPRLIIDVMSALGAWRVWTGSAVDCGSYDHHERREVHFLWLQGHPVENLLQKRVHGLDAVAPDGGCTEDVRDRMVASSNGGQVDDLESRTRRAVTEEISVSLLEKVVGTSYSRRPETATKSTSSANPVPAQIGSNAPPPADVSTCVVSNTKSSSVEFRHQMANFPRRSRNRTILRDGLCRRLVGPGRTSIDTRSGREPRRHPAPVRRPVRRRSSARRVPGGVRALGSICP